MPFLRKCHPEFQYTRYNKHPRIQAHHEARVGDIVQIKESAPGGTWKIRRISEMIKSNDGEERAARVLMPNKNILQRSTAHLYPVECYDENLDKEANDKSQEKNTQPEDNTEDEEIIRDNINEVTRPRRKAAQEARDKSFGQTQRDN